jgi:hypothetical protein
LEGKNEIHNQCKIFEKEKDRMDTVLNPVFSEAAAAAPTERLLPG